MKKGVIVLAFLALGVYIFQRDIHGSQLPTSNPLDVAQGIPLTVPLPGQDAPAFQTVAQGGSAQSSLVVYDSEDLIPLHGLHSDEKVYVLTLGQELDVFRQALSQYVAVEWLDFEQDFPSVLQSPHIHQPVIIALGTYIPDALIAEALALLVQQEVLITLNFGQPDNLSRLPDTHAWLQLPGADSLSQKEAAQILVGARLAAQDLSEPQALIPTPSSSSPVRLAFEAPAYTGLSSQKLAEIDDIVQQGIAASAMPGCQVLVAHQGKVVFHKAFGYHTYQQIRPVHKSDLYDLASITKVSATTLAIMKLYELGQIQLDDPLYTYFEDVYIQAPYTTDSSQRIIAPVFHISIQDLLTHRSGLPPSIPLTSAIKTGMQDSLSWHYFRTRPDTLFQIQVAQKLYLRKDYHHTVWEDIKHLPVRPATPQYSDVNMLLLQRLIEQVSGQPMNVYLYQQFYRKLGLTTMGFTPRSQIELERIVPTSWDGWRGQLLHGHVHDPLAAALGGVAGHAGLFSNTYDLAIVFQMILQKGTYGGITFLQPNTIEAFTQIHDPINHRAMGFDTPSYNLFYPGATSNAIFGHTGFTGTCVWVDPENELIYIFLSNRVHPSARNWTLNSLRIRERVHQVIYDAMYPGEAERLRRTYLANLDTTSLELPEEILPTESEIVSSPD